MIKSLLSLLALGATTLALHAEGLSAPTAVQTQPNANAPVIKVLSPGTKPIAAPAEIMAATPAGWSAIQVAGPFEGYVRNGDIDKGLHVKPGSSIHLQPSTSAGVLAIMEAGDKTIITGLHGKWTQINLEKSVIGYIRGSVGGAAKVETPALVDVPAPAASTPAASAAPKPAPAAGSTPIYTSTSDKGGILPRLFQGTFVSTRRPFTPRRPYDWQINDAAGVRYAYLDISKLLLTEQIEKYTDREVVVYGTPVALSDGKNIVIKVESLRLR